MRDAGQRGVTGVPTVVYIAGSGRSGTTLVERAIGATDGYVNVGEALDLYRQALDNNELCGCGSPLRECPFWGELIESVDVLRDPARVARMSGLQGRLVRQRNFARMLLTGRRGGAFGAQLREYGAGYLEIYRAVVQAAGTRHVVDASKWPVQALALASAGVDVRVVHVVRDPRGVASSHSRTDVERPHAARETMFSRPAVSAALRWTITQTQVDALRLVGVPTALLSYEAFVDDPAGAVSTALTSLGLPTAPDELGHLGRRHAVLPVSHGIAGNPSRFRSGPTQLRVDTRWRRDLSTAQKAAVLALAVPHLSKLRRAARRARPAGLPASTKGIS